ncbi:hypothetical protein [Pseudomonas syringae group genomosp. 3]|uniref:hypothetical protein n=1 Tax=Pseudomonas syringae group genomosp. 3 TaxID=251701 RepID=UPI0005C9D1A2|nr:hypothetical protein [Pseudomonas syringae group genomosp. 3]
MTKQQSYEVLFDDLPYMPLARVDEFRKRALALVGTLSVGRIKAVSLDIDDMIEQYFQVERDRWVQKQVEIGGTIWGHLPDELRDELHLRQLIEAPPSYISIHELDFPCEQNTSALEALEQAIVFTDTESEDSIQPHEYLAVLALRDMENMVRDFHSRTDSSSNQNAEMYLRFVANSMMDIVETICRGEELRHEARTLKSFQKAYRKQVHDRAADMAELRAEALAAEKVKARHGDAARKGHESRNGAVKERLLAEWEQYKIGAKTRPNMAEFARKAERSGRYSVLENTIKKWIRDSKK